MTKTRVSIIALAALTLAATNTFAATKPEIDPPGAVSYTQLAKTAKPGTDFKVIYKPGVRSFLIAAPHGGNIEPGSFELAEAIAGNTYGFYAFNGLKRDSSAFCVPSTRFDEPELVRVRRNYTTIIAFHVIPSSDRIIYVGGNYRQLGDKIIKALSDQGFQTTVTPPEGSAWNQNNLVNKGTIGGVQVEVSSAIVDGMFRGPSSSDRVRQDVSRRTPDFARFVDAIKRVIGRSDNHPTGVRIHSPEDKSTDEKKK